MADSRAGRTPPGPPDHHPNNAGWKRPRPIGGDAPFQAPADGLAEQTLSSEQAYRGRFLEVRLDVARLPDGSTSTREYVVHPGAAAMVPIADDQRILVERQYRYGMNEVYVEIPAGKIDAGESSIVTARRELLEETGYVAREWAFLTQIHPAIGFSDERLDIYLARGLALKSRSLDVEEFLEIEWVTLGWLVDAVRAGRLPDVKTQIAVHWLERFHSGAWDWPAFDL
ncbi:MAG: NUDIX domain-containing protein [Lautropia sp.]